MVEEARLDIVPSDVAFFEHPGFATDSDWKGLVLAKYLLRHVRELRLRLGESLGELGASKGHLEDDLHESVCHHVESVVLGQDIDEVGSEAPGSLGLDLVVDLYEPDQRPLQVLEVQGWRLEDLLAQKVDVLLAELNVVGCDVGE